MGPHKEKPLGSFQIQGLCMLAERERFELSIEVYPLYSLSRRAPSADSDTSPVVETLPPLKSSFLDG